MLDGVMRKAFDPVVNRWGKALAARGWTANWMTLFGLGLGLTAAALLALGFPAWMALAPVLAGRIADGLDGALARATVKTDFGGFLDITCDFLFYSAIPLAFVIRDPDLNGLAGAFLLTSFYVNGATFLGYAVLAEKRGLETAARGEKSLYFSAGLLEGTETIAVFIAMCLFPAWFGVLAYGYAALCALTVVQRSAVAVSAFRD